MDAHANPNWLQSGCGAAFIVSRKRALYGNGRPAGRCSRAIVFEGFVAIRRSARARINEQGCPSRARVPKAPAVRWTKRRSEEVRPPMALSLPPTGRCDFG
jgi:hypothetical protein